jgi:hypothetical protein
MFLVNETSSAQQLKTSIMELLAGEGLDFIVIKLIIVISHQTFRFANFLFKFANIAIRFAKFLPGLQCLPYGLRNFQVCLRISS